ncbi:MAG TPA: MFS transporter [Bacteroidales bacterium]|nr:MFS transporter [Bacteroidales bacterium]
MLKNKSILFVTTLSSFLTPFMGSAINVALPTMGKELSLDTIDLGWVATSYLLAASLFLLPFGKLADRNGRRKFFLSGIWLFTIASLITGLSVNAWMLIGARFINGIGGALIYATAIAILTSSYDKSIRGKVLGINVASVYLGLSIGPTVGGILTMYLGWRSIFYLNAILAAIVIPIATSKLPADSASGSDKPFDIQGSLIYALSLALIIYGFPKIPELTGTLLVAAGVTGLIIFAYLENKAQDPLLNIVHFSKNKVFLFSNAAAFINYAATFALVFLLSFYLQQVKHFSPRESGLILMAQPVMMTIISPLAGKLSDRIQPSVVSSIGMAVTTAGLGAFIFLTADTGTVFIILMLLMLGIGFGLFSSPNTNAVMSSVKPPEYGLASATLGTMRLVGQTMSMGITLMIFAITMGKQTTHITNVTGLISSIHLSFLTFAILCFIGIFFSLGRGSLTDRN